MAEQPKEELTESASPSAQFSRNLRALLDRVKDASGRREGDVAKLLEAQQGTFSDWKRGRVLAPILVRKEIARLFEVPEDVLTNGDIYPLIKDRPRASFSIESLKTRKAQLEAAEKGLPIPEPVDPYGHLDSSTRLQVDEFVRLVTSEYRDIRYPILILLRPYSAMLNSREKNAAQELRTPIDTIFERLMEQTEDAKQTGRSTANKGTAGATGRRTRKNRSPISRDATPRTHKKGQRK